MSQCKHSNHKLSSLLSMKETNLIGPLLDEGVTRCNQDMDMLDRASETEPSGHLLGHEESEIERCGKIGSNVLRLLIARRLVISASSPDFRLSLGKAWQGLVLLQRFPSINAKHKASGCIGEAKIKNQESVPSTSRPSLQ